MLLSAVNRCPKMIARMNAVADSEHPGSGRSRRHGIASPCQQQRCYYENARRIAEPPGAHDRPRCNTRRNVAQQQTGGADAGTDDGSRYGNHNEFIDVDRFDKTYRATDQIAKPYRADHGLQRIAARNGERNDCCSKVAGHMIGGKDGHVGRKCADQNARPYAQSKQQNGRQRDAGRRPNRRCIGRRKSEQQAQARRCIINHRQSSDARQPLSSDFQINGRDHRRFLLTTALRELHRLKMRGHQKRS